MDAQQELFTALKLGLEAKGYSVYDGELPSDDPEAPEGAEYPFIYLGDFRQTDTELKNAVMGVVYPTVHVWHNNVRQRGIVSAMLADVKNLFREISRTNNYSWMAKNINSRIFPDNTTKTPLLHGVSEADLHFS